MVGGGLLAGLQGSANPVPPAGLLSNVVWTMDDPRFGGFSAIEVQPDGLGFVALSDKGAFVRGRFTRDGDGRISKVDGGRVTPLKGQGEEPLRPGRTDSEGLAIAPDGGAYVSFEGPARVLRYARPVSYTHLDVYKRQVYAYNVLEWETIQIGVFGILGAVTAMVAAFIGGGLDLSLIHI